MAQVRIKICGITRPEDAEAAAKLGADFIGLNFYPRSPRYLSEKQARDILGVLSSATEAIGLMVETPLLEACRLAEHLGLATMQIHGEHREVFPGSTPRFIPAFPVRDASSLTRIRDYVALLGAAGCRPAALLVDAHVPGWHGGTGRTAPWHLLADFDAGVPLILAGGLTPENVAKAIRLVRPYGVDVASGVEAAPGVKDREKMRRFIEAVRESS